MERKCSRCHKLLPLTDFSKHYGKKSRKDNLSSWCKKCRSEARKVPHDIKLQHKKQWDEKLKINELSETDAAYIAGFLDGEGSICLQSNHTNDLNRSTSYHLRVTITNTFPGIIDWLAFTVGYGNVHARKIYPGANKQGWDWSINGRRAINLLKQLYPFLKVKRLQAEVAFKFAETLSFPGQNRLSAEVIDIRERLREKLSILNH